MPRFGFLAQVQACLCGAHGDGVEVVSDPAPLALSGEPFREGACEVFQVSPVRLDEFTRSSRDRVVAERERQGREVDGGTGQSETS